MTIERGPLVTYQVTKHDGSTYDVDAHQVTWPSQSSYSSAASDNLIRFYAEKDGVYALEWAIDARQIKEIDRLLDDLDDHIEWSRSVVVDRLLRTLARVPHLKHTGFDVAGCLGCFVDKFQDELQQELDKRETK